MGCNFKRRIDFGLFRLPWRLNTFLSRFSPSIRYFLHLIYAPICLKSGLNWTYIVLQTRLHDRLPLFIDRQLEFMTFWNLNLIKLVRFYCINGYPGQEKYKKAIQQVFEESKSDNDQLHKAYVSTELHYTLQLMVEYERFSMIIPYLDILTDYFCGNWSNVTVVDYGCGASDIGILLAKLGAKVIIVDLNGKRSKFAEWRYLIRGLTVACREVNSMDEYAEFGEGSIDLFIVTEVFEHVRNPMRLLQIIATSLRSGGILFDSMGGKFDRDIVGDHLIEAIEIGNSTEYKKYYAENFKHFEIVQHEDLNFAFIRQ